MSEYDLEDIIDRESCAIFSDPESEWTGTIKVEEPEDDLYHLQPESEQRSEIIKEQANNYRIPGFSFNEI